ncbi:adenine-specific methyltransferase EcoRI family protein, partial [Candidatus Parcubacteria bacterium]|nr:adenine-specific methyltransferase EcoRI family protein [Candidatus Parcubacteria bacterium]
PECIELLKQADIIVTNPPFSLFREYAAQLVEHDKKFVIIGNDNANTYKEIFKLIKENKIWSGYNKVKEFCRPDGLMQKFGNVGWFTNLEINKRHEDLILYETYKGNEKKYPKYDNYDAINIDKTKDIPADYKGAMGVPITFLDKYNPEQFEIIGHIGSVGYDGVYSFANAIYINGRKLFKRILIKNKKVKK